MLTKNLKKINYFFKQLFLISVKILNFVYSSIYNFPYSNIKKKIVFFHFLKEGFLLIEVNFYI